MLKMTLLAAAALLLALEGQAGPPASYDNPDAAEDSSDEGAVSFERGDYLPVQYRGEIIDDWKGAGLTKPKKGYEWVRVGASAYLINLTGGFIKDASNPED